MAEPSVRIRKIRIFRYEPQQGGEGRFDEYTLTIGDEKTTTILDVLLRIQREQDATLSFRYACRVNMCGSCGMVINGRERLACKTNVSHIPQGQEITLRPLNHFPVIKDLVVDMEPFFRKYEEAMPYFEPREESTEPAVIRPDTRERQDIGMATDCIACGCCVSSCTMCRYHEGYAGPAALNRAFTLLADKRDGLFEERLDAVLGSCYKCRTELNCTEVCPKGISGTRAIKYIQRIALKQAASENNGAGPGPSRTKKRTLFPGFGAGLFGPVGLAIGISVIILAIYMSAAAHKLNDDVAVPDRALTASETRGLRVYLERGCSSCHQIQGRGGHRTGPDLANIRAKGRSTEFLAKFVKDPQAVRSWSAMPAYDMPEQDLNDLAQFIMALNFDEYPLKVLKQEDVLKGKIP